MYSNLSIIKFTLHFTAIPIVWFVIYTVTACYSYYIYYNESALRGHPFIKIFFSLIFYFCSFMTVICHTMSIYTEPGLIDQDELSKLKSNKKTFCKKCNKYRPLRAHHCSTCKKCVMKLDHHCPWIFNCVGYKNQKIFFLFLFYASFGCLIAFILLCTRIFTSDFSYALRHPRFKINVELNFWQIFVQTILSLSEPLMLVAGAALAFSVSVSVGFLFGNQIYCLSRNVTQVESAIYSDDQEQNPWYAKKDRWFMVKTVLGLGDKWKWFLPIMESNKYNGGYTYDTPYERIIPEKKKNNEHKHNYLYGFCVVCKSMFCCCCC